MNEKLCITEDRYVSGWQWETLTHTNLMRLKTRTTTNKRGKKVAYIVSLDFIRIGGGDKFYAYDYYKMKCSVKMEKIILQFLDTNPPQMERDGQAPRYKYYDLPADIMREAYYMGHSFSEAPIEFFSIFLKEEMEKGKSGWHIKVPMTAKEIKAKKASEAGSKNK